MPKSTYTGTIERQGQKIVLVCGNGMPPMALDLNGFNPAADFAALSAYIGYKVSVEGILMPGGLPSLLSVDGIGAIKVIETPSAKPKSGGPRL